MLVISTSKDGCTIERVAATHRPVTLKRMMRASNSNKQHPKLTLAPPHMDTRRN